MFLSLIGLKNTAISLADWGCQDARYRLAWSMVLAFYQVMRNVYDRMIKNLEV